MCPKDHKECQTFAKTVTWDRVVDFFQLFPGQDCTSLLPLKVGTAVGVSLAKDAIL